MDPGALLPVRLVLLLNRQLTAPSYLQWNVRVQLEVGHFVCPGQELLSVRIDVVVKDGSLRGELDRFKLADPPFAELNSIIYKLLQNKHTKKVELRGKPQASSGGLIRVASPCGIWPLTWSWNMAPPKAQRQANTK